MRTYTVVGFWRDTQQRFMDSAVAKNADQAECIIGGMNPGLTIVGSIIGKHKCADPEVYIQEFGE